MLTVVYAHPLLTVQLCVLFNVMSQYGIVPDIFCGGDTVPILKDNNGDHSDINNYRGTRASAGFWLGGQCPLAVRGEENFENLTTKWCILK